MSNPVLERFREFHRALLDMLDHARPKLAEASDRRNAAALVAVREQFVATLTEYQSFKHQAIFDPVIASGSAERAGVAHRMKVACIAAAAEYQAYRGQQATIDVGERWPEYRLAASRQMRLLRDHLEREGQAVTRLLADQPDGAGSG